MNVYFKKLRPDVKTPTQGTPFAAGRDIYAVEDGVIHPGHTIKVPTGLALELPEGHMGIFYPRGSVAAQGVDFHSTPIDEDYRGECFILMHYQAASDWKTFSWKAGERIAQLVVIPVPYYALQEVDLLTATARGSGAFGSTGK